MPGEAATSHGFPQRTRFFAKRTFSPLTNTPYGYIMLFRKYPAGYLEAREMEKNCCHQKHTPRDEASLKQLRNRLNRMTGQLNGIARMLDENRYCGDTSATPY